MKAISSRLQSRIAKRRNVIANWEIEYDNVRAGIWMARRLVTIAPEPEYSDVLVAGLKQAGAAKRNVREAIRQLSEDQSLDKQLLKMAYSHEFLGFDLGSLVPVSSGHFELARRDFGL